MVLLIRLYTAEDVEDSGGGNGEDADEGGDEVEDGDEDEAHNHDASLSVRRSRFV